MRGLLLLCVLLVVMGSNLVTPAFAEITLVIDFEERPVPDLSKLDNSYLGNARYVYAFLVAKGEDGAATDCDVAGYDVGYRLVSPDSSVVNHGFHRLSGWNALDAAATDFPRELSATAPKVPLAIGYWTLELKNGKLSHAELQLVPNPRNNKATVSLVKGNSEVVSLSRDKLSRDRKCYGLVNRAYYVNAPYVMRGDELGNGEIVAAFMPGVIDMDRLIGSAASLSDPALKEIAERYGMTGVKRLYGGKAGDTTTRLSRLGCHS